MLLKLDNLIVVFCFLLHTILSTSTLFPYTTLFRSKGDEVILPSPYWVSYSDMTQLFGGVPVRIPSGIDTDFKISPEQLEARSEEHTSELQSRPHLVCRLLLEKKKLI